MFPWKESSLPLWLFLCHFEVGFCHPRAFCSIPTLMPAALPTLLRVPIPHLLTRTLWRKARPALLRPKHPGLPQFGGHRRGWGPGAAACCPPAIRLAVARLSHPLPESEVCTSPRRDSKARVPLHGCTPPPCPAPSTLSALALGCPGSEQGP